jgi:hypothetical protein
MRNWVRHRSRGGIGALMATMMLALTMVSCHSASIQSTRDPSFSGRLTRIFIILNHGEVDQLDADYTPALVRALQQEFAKTRTTITVRAVNVLALNDPNYARELAQYQPDGVLTMKLSGGVRGAYGGLESLFYDVSLISAQQPDRRIWRAQLNAAGGSAVIEGKMNSAAEELVQRLLDDRLIQ